MKISRHFLVVVATGLFAAASDAAFAGVPPDPAVVPEPTALLVWLGLAAAAGLLYSRRSCDDR